MPNFDDLNEISCPACGHVGKPIAKQPGGMTADVAEHVRGLGAAISAARAAATTLHCANCDAVLNTSMIDKGKNAAKQARGRIAGLLRRTDGAEKL